MNASLRSLAAAASAAAALLAAPAARADHYRYPAPPPDYTQPMAAPAYPQPAVPPAYLPALPPRPVVAPAYDLRFAWRELRAELGRLELARERFYASWRGNPWRQRRFEGWYASRRAELERRREMLAMRSGWREGGERYAWHGRHDDD